MPRLYVNARFTCSSDVFVRGGADLCYFVDLFLLRFRAQRRATQRKKACRQSARRLCEARLSMREDNASQLVSRHLGEIYPQRTH